MMAKPKHNRADEILQNYWRTLRGTRAFPSENTFDPDAITDIWPSCFLVSIDDVTRRLGYRYSYLGDHLIEAYGDDLRNHDVVKKLLSTHDTSTARRFDEVTQGRKPVFDEGMFINLRQHPIKYRACLLPLGETDDAVSHIIGCMSWRIY